KGWVALVPAVDRSDARRGRYDPAPARLSVRRVGAIGFAADKRDRDRQHRGDLGALPAVRPPHNYTQHLRDQKVTAAPGNVRRAEEFMRANACPPLTIAAIAQ